ncbi:hypothetical protein ACFL96_04460 [Thermoproteota archaeon]
MTIMKTYLLEEPLPFNKRNFDNEFLKNKFRITDDALICFKSARTIKKEKSLSQKELIHVIVQHNKVTPEELVLLKQLAMRLILSILGDYFSLRNNKLYFLTLPISESKAVYSKTRSSFYIGIQSIFKRLTKEKPNAYNYIIDHKDFALRFSQSYNKEIALIKKSVSALKPPRVRK